MSFNKQNIITLFICFFLTTSCTATMVGGAGVGGYHIGKDKRSFGTIVDDGTITTKINAKYVQDSDIKTMDIDVETYQGVVTLYGHVQNKMTLRKAIAIAESTQGVKEVRSELRVIE